MSHFFYKLNSFICLVILISSLQPAIAQQKRIALVIGNAAYKAAPLKNPVNDASDMSNKLKEFGFQVEILLNAN
ncbi:MAG: caspase family protein, partial [Pseudomonadota bacterium]